MAGSRRGSTYRAGRLTRAAIVRAAEAVLMEHGHAQFTVQRVAAQLDISPGNINYYFPTRASLLEALILNTLEQYRRRVLAIGRSAGAALPVEFDAVLRWLMLDAVTPRGSRLFRQLWAIAANDARVAIAMDSFYTRSVRGHLRRLGLHPAATRKYRDLEAIMCLVHVISEGTTVLFGTRRRARALFERVQSLAERAIAQLVASAGDGT
jgi:AcrR family transcriptional regulator